MTSFAGRIANLLPGPVTRWLRYASLRRGRRTWSQEGEDGILARIFEGQRQGFYVDVGAHHPFRFSNTYFFYRQGWRGLNIDAAPGSMRPFRSHRPRDINVECGIGLTAGRQDFFVFNDPALSTFDPVQAKLRNVPPWRVLETIAVPVRPLREVLAEQLPAGVHIDFLSIDVEGRDADVLQSNDWSRFRPDMVLVEAIGRSLEDIGTDRAAILLRSHGYALYGKCVNTVIFMRQGFRSGGPS